MDATLHIIKGSRDPHGRIPCYYAGFAVREDGAVLRERQMEWHVVSPTGGRELADRLTREACFGR